jgi:hypothetical protein
VAAIGTMNPRSRLGAAGLKLFAPPSSSAVRGVAQVPGMGKRMGVSLNAEARNHADLLMRWFEGNSAVLSCVKAARFTSAMNSHDTHGHIRNCVVTMPSVLSQLSGRAHACLVARLHSSRGRLINGITGTFFINVARAPRFIKKMLNTQFQCFSWRFQANASI